MEWDKKIHQKKELSNRDLTFRLHRLRWLDQEITRQRDYEWKATSFHAAFFVAILYLLIDPAKREYLLSAKCLVSFTIIVYFFIICSQLLYTHFRLNMRRNERSKLLESIGAPFDEEIKGCCGFCEGTGVIFILTFLISLLFLAMVDLFLLFYGG